MENIHNLFSVGYINKQGSELSVLHVESKKDLEFVVYQFDKFGLITQKQADYELWRKAYYVVKNKEHLTEKGLKEIVAIKASLNKGLPDQLKIAFSDIIPHDRPLVTNQKIPDPNWLAGFTTARGGEGCFFINIYKSPGTKLKESVKLVFQLSQQKKRRAINEGARPPRMQEGARPRVPLRTYVRRG